MSHSGQEEIIFCYTTNDILLGLGYGLFHSCGNAGLFPTYETAIRFVSSDISFTFVKQNKGKRNEAFVYFLVTENSMTFYCYMMTNYIPFLIFFPFSPPSTTKLSAHFTRISEVRNGYCDSFNHKKYIIENPCTWIVFSRVPSVTAPDGTVDCDLLRGGPDPVPHS
jgi:hypothetical protein